MAELICNVPSLKTAQDLENAIHEYKNSDLTGNDLYCLWQAIREGALEQLFPEPEHDRVPCEDSY